MWNMGYLAMADALTNTGKVSARNIYRYMYIYLSLTQTYKST